MHNDNKKRALLCGVLRDIQPFDTQIRTDEFAETSALQAYALRPAGPTRERTKIPLTQAIRQGEWRGLAGGAYCAARALAPAAISRISLVMEAWRALL